MFMQQLMKASYDLLICRMTILYLYSVMIVMLTLGLLICAQAKEKSFFNVLMSMIGFWLKTDKLFMYMCCCLLFLCYKGIEHKLHFTHCNCEPLAVTLTRAQLWPATPNNPYYAFSFSLLDWAEALMLECQVALKDFCKTIKFRCPFHSLKVCTCS